MTTYKSENKNNFLFNTLEVFKNFNLYSGLELYDILEENKEIVKNSKIENLRFQELSYDVPITRLNGKVTYRKTKLNVKESKQTSLYHQPADMNCYSFDTKPGYRPVVGFDVNYVNESYIRKLNTEDFFLYIQLPYKFLRDHLGANIANADTQKYFKAIDTLPEITVENLIKMHDKYDEIFPELSPYTTKRKFEPIPIWRKDIFPYMVYTLAKYGYYNPIIHTKQESLFKDGSHRLVCGAAVKKDVPVLLKIPRKYIKEGICPYITTPIMVGNRVMVLEVSLNDNNIKGWYVSPKDLPDNGNMNFNQHQLPSTKIIDSHLIDIHHKYKSHKPDVVLK